MLNKIIFTLILHLFLLIFGPLACQANQAWKHFLLLTAGGSSTVHNRYAKAMGYNYVGYRSSGTRAQYIADPTTQDMLIYEGNPYSRAIRSLVGNEFYTLSMSNFGTYSASTRNWCNDNLCWGSTTASPTEAYRFAGNQGSLTGLTPYPDFQQQRVIDLMIIQIMQEFGSMTYAPKNTQFAGYIIDETKLSGAFWKWSGGAQRYNLSDTDRTGTDSSLIHALSTGGDITHEYATIQDGIAQFYKQLNGSMTATYPNAKWILEPSDIYGGVSVDNWVQIVSQRSDKALLTPDMLFQELASSGTLTATSFTDNELIFSSGMAIDRSMVGSMQCTQGGEDINRQIAIACATSTAFFNWSFVFSNGGSMPSYADVINYETRHKLIRCIPNWSNILLEGESTSTTCIVGDDNGTVSCKILYPNGDILAYINSDVYYGRQPGTSTLIYAAFGTNSTMGSVTLRPTETFLSATYVNFYYEPTTDATNDFVWNGNAKILSLASGVTVDTGNWTGYIITVGTASASVSGSGTIKTSGGGQVTISN